MNAERLQIIHDQLKNHPYRKYMCEDDKEDYLHKLYELSERWCDIIWREDLDEAAAKKMRQFGEWIHDYRAMLWKCRRKDLKFDYWKHYFVYYEMMLSVTHRFLETGYMDEYYEPNRDALKNNGDKLWYKYKYITKEECGIDSKYVPGYFCINAPYDVDEGKMLERLKRWYKYSGEDVILEKFEEWKKNEKPIHEYVNSIQ